MYQAYLLLGKAADVFRADPEQDTGKFDVGIESVLRDQARVAGELSRNAYRDPSGEAAGFTGVQWFKNRVESWQTLIIAEMASGFGGGEQYYCIDAANYSQSIQDGLFQDPDGTSLKQLLQDEIKYDVTLGEGNIYQVTAQERLAWLTAGYRARAHSDQRCPSAPSAIPVMHNLFGLISSIISCCSRIIWEKTIYWLAAPFRR